MDEEKFKVLTPKQLRYIEWLRVVDAWRLKFKHPLTREQAIDVLRDEREFKDGEFTSPKMSDITCWKEYSEFREIK